jgi:uncharacterized membrane protein (DUF485 family)
MHLEQLTVLSQARTSGLVSILIMFVVMIVFAAGWLGTHFEKVVTLGSVERA